MARLNASNFLTPEMRFEEYNKQQTTSLVDILIYARQLLLSFKKNKNLITAKPQTDGDWLMYLTKITNLDPNIIAPQVSAVLSALKYSSSQVDSQHYQLTYESVRQLIVRTYSAFKVPTCEIIHHNLCSGIKKKDISLIKALKECGYIPLELCYGKGMIVEDPKQLYKRMLYLNKIQLFRNQERCFLYIAHKDDAYFLAVSPKFGVLSFEIRDKNNSDDNDVTKCFQNLRPLRPKGAVVVLETDVPRATPNQYSTKQEMRDWLDKHSICYESDAHTAELYYLIRKFKNKYPETSIIRDLVGNSGVDVIQVPTEMPGLNYFNLAFKQFDGLDYKNSVQYVSSIFSACSIKDLEGLETTLKNEEKRIYLEDLEMETIVDKLRKAKYTVEDVLNCDKYNSVRTEVQ